MGPPGASCESCSGGAGPPGQPGAKGDKGSVGESVYIAVDDQGYPLYPNVTELPVLVSYSLNN